MKAAVLGMAVLFVVSGCADHPGSFEAVVEQSEELIGGRLAGDAEFPSAVFLLERCSASKVGPRHFLTANHCVSPSPGVIEPLWRAGATVRITNQNLMASPRSLTVVETSTPTPYYGDPAWRTTPDLAVIRVAETTPEIPFAVVDASTVLHGDPVVEMGYGCEEQPDTPSPFRLKLNETTARTDLLSGYTPDHSAELATVFVNTATRLAEPTASGLCKGDSGGPLHRWPRVSCWS